METQSHTTDKPGWRLMEFSRKLPTETYPAREFFLYEKTDRRGRVEMYAEGFRYEGDLDIEIQLMTPEEFREEYLDAR